MQTLRFRALATDVARHYQDGGADANGRPAETRISKNSDGLCRHCLTRVPAGAPYLVLAHRPFPDPQPYAEVGPIFVHAERCARHADTQALPEGLRDWPDYLLKGYDADDRIVYGTGQIVPTDSIPTQAAKLLAMDDVRYVDVRSARNNCWQVRVSLSAP